MSDCSCATNQPNCPVHGPGAPVYEDAPPKTGRLFGEVVSVEADPDRKGHVMVKVKVMIKLGGPLHGGWSAYWPINRFPMAEQPRVGETIELKWRVDV